MPRHSIPTPSFVAYSLLRFSTPEQAKGDSRRRQTQQAEDWCERNKVTLDKSLWLYDPAVSGFTGKHKENPDRHALAAFLKLIENGRVPHGSYLLIENLDRLSREDEVPACHLLTGILLAGVKVVQMSPYEMVLTEKSNGWELMRAVMELSRGHGESAIKSERVGAAWQDKKDCARKRKPQPPRKQDRVNGMDILTHCLPSWVEERGGKLYLVPEKATAIKRIYHLAANGCGRKVIARMLIEEQVPPISRSEHWSASYVAIILCDRRAVGEYQPKRKRGREKDGDPIPGYFPAVVKEEEWQAARAGAIERRKKKGRTSSNYVNMFAGLLKNARDGGSYFCTTRVTGGNGKTYRHRLLINTAAAEGWAKSYSFPFDTFEAAVLSLLREVDPREVLGNVDNKPDEVLLLGGELSRIEGDIAVIEAELDARGESPVLHRRLRAKEDQMKLLVKQLAAAQQQAANPLSEAWGAFQTLLAALDAAPDPIAARLRLRSLLRRAVSEMWMLVVPRGCLRLAAVQVYFAGDGHRDYLILHQPPKSNGKQSKPGDWWAGSLLPMSPTVAPDLRKPGAAAAMGRVLTVVDLAALEKALTTGDPAAIGKVLASVDLDHKGKRSQ